VPGGISFTGGATASLWGGNVSTAVTNSSLAVERVDDMILRIMTPYYHLGQDLNFPVVDESTVPLGFSSRANWGFNYTLGPLVDVRAEHAKLIRELGAAGTVLLKNVNSTLPLKTPKNIGVFGNDAADLTHGQYTLAISSGLASGDYDIGTLAAGGGSGTGRFTYVIPPLDAIKARYVVHYHEHNIDCLTN
jgi:beta-glucosidase